MRLKSRRWLSNASIATAGLLALFEATSFQAVVRGDEPARKSEMRASRTHFAGVPLGKPADRPLSAATARLYDKWNPLADFDNEFYTVFKYSRISGIGKDAEVSRRDPSKVVKLGDTYYVWYTRRKTEHPPVGLKNYTDDTPDDVPAWDWDLADIYYATSRDGFNWTEQGVAVSRNAKGEYADRSLSTPDILCVNQKFYLYFQAFTGRMSHGKGDRCNVSMAWADSADGPWHKINRPIIELGEPGAWDSGSIHDPYPLVYKGRIWLYCKSDVWLQDASGAPVDRLDGTPAYMGRTYHRMHGVSIADRPEGPFVKSPLNPIANSGHETCLFPYKQGIVSLIIKDGPEKNTVQYAADGLNFIVKATVVQPPVAAGPFCPDAFAGDGDGCGICWGLSHVVGYGNGFLIRFDCDLHRDIDRPPLKHGTIQADEAAHFQPRTTLPRNLRRQFMQEAATARGETANIRLHPKTDQE